MLAELFRRSVWLTLGSATGRILPLLVLMAASRSLDASGFATASAGFAWAGIAMSLSSAGLATVMAQRLGAIDDPIQRRTLIGTQLRRSIAASGMLAFMVMLFGSAVVDRLFSGGVDSAVAVPAGLAGALWSQVAMVVAALNGSHRARAAGITLAVSGLLQGLPMACAVVLSTDAVTVVWGLVLGSGAGAVFATWLLHQELGASKYVAHSSTAPNCASDAMSRNVTWHSLATIAVIPAPFFASGMISDGADGPRQLALFFLLEQINVLITYGPAMLGHALMPMISRGVCSEGASAAASVALTRRLVSIALWLAAAGLLIAAILSLFAHGIIERLPQSSVFQYEDIWAVRWMLFGALLVPALSLLGGAIQGRGEIARGAQLNISYCAIFLFGTFFLSDHGTAGLLFARLIAAGTLLLATAAILWQTTKQPALPH